MVWPPDFINCFPLHPCRQTKASGDGRGAAFVILAAHVPSWPCRSRRSNTEARLHWSSLVNMQMRSFMSLEMSLGSNSVISQCQIKSKRESVCVWVEGVLNREGILDIICWKFGQNRAKATLNTLAAVWNRWHRWVGVNRCVLAGCLRTIDLMSLFFILFYWYGPQGGKCHHGAWLQMSICRTIDRSGIWSSGSWLKDGAGGTLGSPHGRLLPPPPLTIICL